MAQQVAHELGQGHGEAAHEGHPSAQTYVKIAIILSIITAVEVAIWYLESVRFILVPALLILSLAKFLMVVGFFMHLKFDAKLFRFMFGAGLILTLAVYLAMLAMFLIGQFWAPLSTG